MSISNLTIQNFKSISHVKMELGAFNVLIGSNAAGKTNIVQAVKFLRDCSTDGFENAFSLQGGSSYFFNSRLKHNQQNSKKEKFTIEFDIQNRMIGFTTHKDTEAIFGLLKTLVYKLYI